MLSIRSAISGEPLELRAAPEVVTDVRELRVSVAATLGVGVKGVALLWDGKGLNDDDEISPEASLDQLTYGVAWGTAEKLRPHILSGRGESHVRLVKSWLTFPEPQGIQINMMPFVIGDKQSIPPEYHQYWGLITSCPCHSERGKVGFLTIHEGIVPKGESQRRGGLHVDMSGMMAMPGRYQRPVVLHWGRGQAEKHVGGIYMASSVTDSCEVWDAKIDQPEEVVGRMGDLEHMRELLGEGIRMKAGELYWLSDETPHESLPLPEETYRQYFRLVTSAVSVWYEQHSTANRLGVECDPKVTRICTHNKFESVAPRVSPQSLVDTQCGKEFVVDLSAVEDASQDLGLGFTVESDVDPSAKPGQVAPPRLLVTYVADGGAAWHWNQLHPEQRILPRYQILEVNDVLGEDGKCLLREIRKSGANSGSAQPKLRKLLVRPMRRGTGGGPPDERAATASPSEP
mmetsp:Transcript_56404/g.167885  ORF Transcript_56404/g.167885 Transcript_56404/m.167885 type:complete len:458 (+) Transcript_56404:52-1425(+)